MVFFHNWGLFPLFESTAGQTTAEEPALKPISPSPSNIPERAFPFSQWRSSPHGRTNPARGQRRQHAPLSSPSRSSIPPQGRGSLTASQGLAKCLPSPESGPEPGWEEGRHWYPGRSGYPEHSIPFHVSPKAQLRLVVPSISSVPRTQGPLSHLLPATHLLFPPATFPEKQPPPNPHFFQAALPLCLPHPLPHYPGSCFCLSWLFWAGSSLGKRIRFKCRLACLGCEVFHSFQLSEAELINEA